MTRPDTVTSIHGNQYRLGQELGRGGQGAVFAVEGGRLAVKLLRDRSARAREALRDQLAMVGRLPLENLAVARPIELLRPPHVGYVMELYTGMVSLRALLRPPKTATSIVQWYFDMGGLRRRLRLLARTAEVLSQLHGRGLVYVDPSPHNVFVSEDRGAVEVRLIDTDNLRTATAAGRALYTPGYGAPEVVTQTGIPSSLSDAHAFAVIAFETLALVHPLLGDAVRDGAPEMEEQALAGRLPWIDDENDDSNRSSDGIPRNIVLSAALRDDFQRTFGPGLRTPSERPGLSRWAEHLHRAADRTVICPGCSGTFFYDKKDCPWCEAPRPSFIIAAVLLWDPQRLRRDKGGVLDSAPGVVRKSSGKPRVVDAVALSDGETVDLTERITHGTSRRTPRLRVSFVEDRLTLEALDGERWRLVSSDGRRERYLASRPLDVTVGDTGAAWVVHSGPPDQLHRVIRFDLRRGGNR
ncbi:MAG: serine/threonine protein kinase [Deltaproteobacteria bacterium]|nr:MAG: serine/threonine protein kinase [Deltaproteobacteria bacterium]